MTGYGYGNGSTAQSFCGISLNRFEIYLSNSMIILHFSHVAISIEKIRYRSVVRSSEMES